MAEDMKTLVDTLKSLPADKPDTSGGIGMTPEFEELNLQLLSHKTASFTVNDNVTEIQIKSPEPIKTLCKLTFGQHEFDCSRCVFSQAKGDTVTLYITFPRPGFYKLSIFALPTHHPSQSLPRVYTYVIDVQNASQDACAYPKQFAPWPTRGCFLHSPLTINPDSTLTEVLFKLYAPGAKRLALKADHDWFHLDKSTSEPDVWEKVINLERYKGENIRLAGGWNDQSTSYDILLEYSI